MLRGKVGRSLQEFRVAFLQIRDALHREGLGAVPIDLPYDHIRIAGVDQG
jgi:hypothetical protein